MPAIQAMRSDALAMRSKEDVQEKIPSFYNQVNQSLGQSIISGQDAAEQLLEQRFAAANQLAAQIRQKVDGQGAIAELSAGAGLKMISSALSITLALLSKTTTTDLLDLASALINFSFELTTLKLQWEAAAATYAQWTVQAGFTGHGDFFATTPPGPPPASVTQSFQATQWLGLGGAGAFASGMGDVTQVQGMLNGRGYSTTTPASPNNLQPYYTRQLTNPSQPFNATTNPYTNVATYVTMDAPGSSAGNPDNTDSIAQVFYDTATGALFLKYNVSFTRSGAPGSVVTAPNVSGTVNQRTYTIDYPDPVADQTVNVLFSAPSQSGSSGQNFTLIAPGQLTTVNLAMGGRGALRYRDALTPRFTDRNTYAGGALGTRAYETWYSWGSVGSISRVGQYT